MSRTLRFLSLFVATVFSVMIFSTIAAATPAAQPIPLRVMYLKSDLVFVGALNGSTQWINNKAGYRRTLTISVESPIKGIASGELSVVETRLSPPDGKLSVSLARRIFFLEKQDDSYYLLSNFHGDFALGGNTLDVYAARLRELQNIYLSGVRVNEQIIDWLTAMAADPVTRFDGACDLANAMGRESGTSIDPSGRMPSGDSGSCIDPTGRKGDDGPLLDPDGKGLGVDPNGKSSIFGKDDGRGIDPNGRDAGVIIDPNGKTGDDKDAGPRIDPEGRDAGVIIDPNGRGAGLDPNGRTGDDKDAGVRIDPEGRSFSALNKERLIQAFLAAASHRAPLSDGDRALLYVVNAFHDQRVNIVLAARLGKGFQLDAAAPPPPPKRVDEWGGDVLL